MPTSDACHQKRIFLNESDIFGVPGDKDNMEDISDLPILKRAKRQDQSSLTSDQKKRRLERSRENNMKEKALTLMQQAMYQTQEIIWPLEPIFKKYEKDGAYRMAFVFLKLHSLMAEAKAILKVLETRRKDYTLRWSASQRIQVYWQLMKRNMDATYLVEYIQERVNRGTEGVDTKFVPIPSTTKATETSNATGTTTTTETTTTTSETTTTQSSRL